MKTKIRRLYDIANIMVSVGLITKTTLQSTKKPAFRWAGAEHAERHTSRITSSPTSPDSESERNQSGSRRTAGGSCTVGYHSCGETEGLQR